MGVTVAPRYAAQLQRDGVGVREMLVLLEAYARHGDWERVRREALEANLLGKTSRSQVRGFLKAFRRRFLSDRGLPPAQTLALFVGASVPEGAVSQVLLAYYLRADPLAERCYRDLVLARLCGTRAELTVLEVAEYLGLLARDHPELGRWSTTLRARWIRGFRTLLRRLGVMERAPSSRLRRPWVFPETFGFFWLWAWEHSGSVYEAGETDLWELYRLEPDDRERLLVEGQTRRWWIYHRAGSIVQFRPAFGGLEEWLRYGLARDDA